VQQVGRDVYLTEQFARAKTGYITYPYVMPIAPTTCRVTTDAVCARDNYTLYQLQRAFFQNALAGADQLRQRVAFALSQILVVSGTEIYSPYGMANYQNMLLDNAFGNYRNVLMNVTLSPVMGNYLNMVNNEGRPAATVPPNENYAREILQLFSIGLNTLNADGTERKDTQGNTIPTYTQDTIIGYAHAFTGWTYPVQPTSVNPAAVEHWPNSIYYVGNMTPYDTHHDKNVKLVLNGATLPANQTIGTDLSQAIDSIFNHPNVGPFIGKLLITHLVTSNPSPAYVGRVTAVFNNNGQGVRGDLRAVVRAILIDAEAKGDSQTGTTYGHLREPVLFMTDLLRSIGGTTDGVYLLNQSKAMGQDVYYPETVFNYYSPEFTLPGQATTFAPEFGIQDTTTVLARTNFVNQLVYGTAAGTTLDLSSLVALAGTPATMITELNQRLMHGTLPTATSQSITQAVNSAGTDATARTRMAVYLLATSPQFQVER
jgi:uncharacterized protein (DUF1800 family)